MAKMGTQVSVSMATTGVPLVVKHISCISDLISKLDAHSELWPLKFHDFPLKLIDTWMCLQWRFS